MKKTTLGALLFPTIALLLEFLPIGITMRFAAPPGEAPFLTKTSYFDLLPFGYGNITPLLTAILTAAVWLLLVLYLVSRRAACWKAGKILSLLAALVSLCPLLFASYTVIGGLISLCLFAESFYLSRMQPPDPKQ